MSLLGDSTDDDQTSKQATLLSVTEDQTDDTATDSAGGGGGAATAETTATQQEADIDDDSETVGDILPADINDDQITAFEADGLEDWVAEREANDESYSYYHLELRQYSDLTAQAQWLAANTVVSHADSVENAYTHQRHGFSNPDPDEVVPAIVTWKLNQMATPYHEEIRPVSAEHIRVFVADEAIDALSEKGIDLEPVLDQLHTLEEHEPSEDYIDQLNTYRELKAKAAYDGPLEAKKKNIEQTVRAKFGFTGRYASAEVPDPHVEYAQYDVLELKEKLESVREELEEKREKKDAMKAALNDYEDSWLEQTLSQEFPSVHERLSDNA